MDRDWTAAGTFSTERFEPVLSASESMAPSGGIKTESAANSSPLPALLLADQPSAALESPCAPLPSTETPDPAESATPMPMPAQVQTQAGQATSSRSTTGTDTTTTTSTFKKKGTASSIVKKALKRRSKPGGDSKKSKKAKPAAAAAAASAADEASDEDDSDNGPYCICRGPDDHRWMICCEACEDWFHGECVSIGKDVGEALIERFVCPNCTSDDLMTIYKKTCALHGCRKAARLRQNPASVFCSNEHAQTWWERMLAKLPKIGTKSAMSDALSQEEFMALLNSGLAGVDGEGVWRFRAPFSGEVLVDGPDGDANAMSEPLAQILTEEEADYLDNMAKSRFRLAEETMLYHKMLSLIEMVQERRRAAINAGRFAEDICGYDHRLDTVCARDAFAAFLKTPEGETIFQTSKVDDPLGEGDEVRGMCERKRCKAHSGWQKMLVLGIRHQIREMTDQAEEVAEEEKIVREAAGERWRRRRAEKNWVEVID